MVAKARRSARPSCGCLGVAPAGPFAGWAGAVVFWRLIRYVPEASWIVEAGLNRHSYRLLFAEDGRRIEFYAKGLPDALAQAASLIPHGHSVSLIEDEVSLGQLSFRAGSVELKTPSSVHGECVASDSRRRLPRLSAGRESGTRADRMRCCSVTIVPRRSVYTVAAPSSFIPTERLNHAGQ